MFKNFVESGYGALEMELCRILNRTPREIGILRHKNPADIAFLEQRIIWEYKQREKQEKESERKSKQRKGGKRH